MRAGLAGGGAPGKTLIRGVAAGESSYQHDDGFTLIEVLVVLVILGLTAGLVLAHGPARSGAVDMRQAAGLVAQALRAGRGEAIARNHAVPVRFDVPSGSLRVGRGAVQVIPRGFAIAVTAAKEQGSAITFLPDGSSTGGTVELRGEGRQEDVAVDWLTGRVSLAPAG